MKTFLFLFAFLFTLTAHGYISPTNTGTVTSVAQTVPQDQSVAGSPVTTTGTLAVTPKAEYSIGNSSTAFTVNWNNGAAQFVTMNGSATATFSNPVNGMTYVLRLVQDGSGSQVITWPSLKWPGGTTGVLTTTAAAVDILTCYYNGTSYYCNLGKDYK